MKLKLLGLVLGLQVAWVLGTVATQEHRLRSAPTVLLETQPVDPRDLLRGDYVILNYKISQIPLKLFAPTQTEALPAGCAVYVVIERRGQFHEAVSASLALPESGSHQTVILGTVDSSWGPGGTGTPVRLRYGLERYYVAEGTGNPAGKLTVEAAVSNSGRATIKQVFVDGKPYREAMKLQARDAN
jgi:uncharacterized membrane-anchored protein